MRRILFAAATVATLGTSAFAQSVGGTVAADASQPVPASSGADQQAAMSNTGHATHDNTGIGTHGNHPKHGKLHGHPNRHACKKHCQEHHDAQISADAAAKATDIDECKKICDDHHKMDSKTNPDGNKVARK